MNKSQINKRINENEKIKELRCQFLSIIANFTFQEKIEEIMNKIKPTMGDN